MIRRWLHALICGVVRHWPAPPGDRLARLRRVIAG